jgi:hypothetical protein
MVKMIFLTFAIMLLIVVFVVDVAQKRRSFLDNDK